MNVEVLQRSIRGRVFSDRQTLENYSVDSSLYQIRPSLVVVPKTIKDIIKTLLFATKNKLSVTPRGGGTGLVGSALNSGIIIDLRNLDRIRIFQNHVEVGAGVHKGRLDQILEKHGKFLGPNPSVGPYCTIGGMIGTNASGSRSLKYGSTIDNLLEVTMITASGKMLKLPSRTRLAQSVVKLARQVDRQKYPQVSKNSCGYRLDAVSNISETQKIIAASEGTLGIVVSAKLRIYDLPKKRILVILGYESIKDAALDCQKIVKLRPSALEFVDHNTMKNITARFPHEIKCLLYVEFDANIGRNVSLLSNTIAGQILYKFSDKKSIAKWWTARNSALYFSLKNLLSSKTLPHIIEDATVPLHSLADLLLLAEKTARRHGVKLVMYGHAGNGNIHIRLASKNKCKKTINTIAKEFFTQVIAMKGTITGEHGDGIARTKFVRMQYGHRTYKLFCKLKNEFDPHNLLNPQKIVLARHSRGRQQLPL